MASFCSNRAGALALAGALSALASAGCVEPVGGSNVEIALAGGAQVPGTPADFGRPPPGTHYEVHAVEYVKDTDMDGNETIVQTFTYEILNLEIKPAVDTTSPCFIEDDESRFPGLHSTMYAAKLREVLGFDDPYAPPATASAGDVIDILTADRRIAGQRQVESGIKAIASHDPAEYPTDIPPADQIDDASNAERKRKCEAFWADHPMLYEGNDKVFTLPLNGTWFGAVDGSDPRNGAFIGGASMWTDADLSQIDGLLLNWQYNCTPADSAANGITCAPDYPDSVPDEQKSDIGVHYMAGDAVDKVRGVINVPLANRTFGQLNGEAVIFANLDDDQVTF